MLFTFVSNVVTFLVAINLLVLADGVSSLCTGDFSVFENLTSCYYTTGKYRTYMALSILCYVGYTAYRMILYIDNAIISARLRHEAKEYEELTALLEKLEDK